MADEMRFGAALWLQRTSWPELRQAALAVEAAGFDDLWVDDHLLNDEGEPDSPKLEGWTTLAALAAVTNRVRLGLLVSANTLRNPGLTAKLAATLDAISGGRAILGLGAGWFEREHDAFGIGFGASTGERLDRLAEAVPLIRQLLDGERVTHGGRFYRLRDALCRPRPVQARLPILVGGSGPRKTLPLVARHADAWNAYGTPDELAAAAATLRARCRDVGRAEHEIVRSVTQNVVIRATTSDALAAWQTWLAGHRPIDGEDRPDLVGSPDDVAAGLEPYRALGFRHSIWVFRRPFDRATIGQLADVRAALVPR